MTVIEATKRNTVNTMEMFLRNFSHIPDDNLTWSPSPTAKSPLRIAAHTALYAGRFAKMIRNRELPIPENLEQWLSERTREETELTNRQEIEPIFRAGTAQVLAALDSLIPEDLESVLDSGQGWTMSMQHLITLPALHATLHTGQIDFLQTCWNDQQVYVG